MTIGIISGYFNPLHTGHLDYIEGAKSICDYLIVIINSDKQVEIKDSTPFMNQDDRARIVMALSDVSNVFISTDADGSVVETLRVIHNLYGSLPPTSADGWPHQFKFMNGGDRRSDNTPEEDFCYNNGIKTVYNVGGNKTQSSSGLIARIE
jgi:cytidyltransferase-like protein